MYRTRDHIDEYREKCTGCGRCREVCPSYRHGGCDPLAVMMGDDRAVFDCVGCGYCSEACEHTDPKTVMLAAYSIVTGKEVSDEFWETGLARPLDDHPSREELPPEWDGDDAYIMPGCVARCLVPYIEHATSVTMRAIGVGASELPDFTCCMYPIQFGCMDDAERDGYRIRMGETADWRELVTLCAGCSEIMERSGVHCQHIIPFLHDHVGSIPALDRPLKVSVEPGCAARASRDMMVDIMERMGCQVVNGTSGCCGKASRKAAGPLMAERQAESEGADVIVVGCPMCLVKYDAYEGGIPVVYITELISFAAGDGRSLGYHRIPVDPLS